MPRIFLSYRRSDVPHFAGRIADALSARYGRDQIFLDFDDIPIGASFREVLSRSIAEADLILPIIGPKWLGDGERDSKLNDPDDFVRLELESALNREIPIIPVLVDRARMPAPRDLPKSLQALSRIQAAEIDAGAEFRIQLDRLFRSIDRLASRRPESQKSLKQADADPKLTAKHSSLLTGLYELANGFFAAANRPIKRTGDQLLVPGPIWLAKVPNPESGEVREFAGLVRPEKRAFLIYEGLLPTDTLNALDRLRVEGKSIIPIAVNVMSAALADGNASIVLSDLERSYESKDTLFDSRNVVLEERFLFGRSALLTQVGAALARGEHVLVTGLRKCGKTSFLIILRQHLSSHPVCFVDLQRYDRHREDWPSALFELIVQAYDNWGRMNFPDWPTSGSKKPPKTASELESILDERRGWQLKRGREERLIVILDEAERIFPGEGEIEEARKYTRAMGALRVLGQTASQRPLSIIAADLRPWLNRKNVLPDGSTNPFFNFLQEVPLPLLSNQAIADFVRVVGKVSGLDIIEDGCIDQLIALSGGHPSIVRMIAGESYKARRTPNALSRNDVAVAIEEMMANDTLGFFFRGNLWGLMTNEEKATLRAAADTSVINGLFYRLLGLVGVRKTVRYPEASATLRQQGILQHGRISIGSFRDWIKEPGNSGVERGPG